MRASLLAAIQGKPSLKKASERKLASPKPDTAKSNAKGGGGGGMMSMLLPRQISLAINRTIRFLACISSATIDTTDTRLLSDMMNLAQMAAQMAAARKKRNQ